MAHNFRIIRSGYRYVSKDGNNLSVTPTNPDTPLKTPSGANNIIGTGNYVGSFGLNTVANSIHYADSTVVFTQTLDLTWTANSPVKFNSETVGGQFIFELNGYSIIGGAGSTICEFWRTQIKNANFATTPDGMKFFKGCVLVNSTGGHTRLDVISSGIFNCNFNILLPLDVNTSLINSFVDESSIISTTASFYNPIRFTNNNFMGTFVVAGTPYQMKKDKAGVLIPSRVSNGIADIDILFGGTGTCYTTYKNFSQDPQFLNLPKEDYWTVASTSPNLILANPNYTNIGNAKLQNTIAKADNTDYFDIVDATNGDILLSGNDLIFDTASANFQDSIPSKKIDLGKVMVLENITATMLLAFDSDAGIGTATNTNVLQVIQNHTSGNAEANPARLTYKMRWTKNTAEPSVDADWDNQGYITAGQYGTFEINAGAKVSSLNGVISTSGEPTFNNLNSAFVVARWVQFELYINEGIDIT